MLFPTALSVNSRALVAFVALLLASGCAAQVQYTPTNQSPRKLDPRPVEEVHVFTTNAPDAAYVEVGIVQASESHPEDVAEVIHELRSLAAKRGCDGIVLTTQSRSRSRESIWGACIVYDAPEPGASATRSGLSDNARASR